MQDIPITRNLSTRVDSPMALASPSPTFLYVAEGELSVLTGTEPLLHRRSDLLFLPQGRDTHISPGDSPASVLILGIREAFLADHIGASPLPFLTSALYPERDYLALKRSVLRVSEKHLALKKEPPERAATASLALMSELFRLLAELSRLLPAASARPVPDRYRERVQEIADYIDLHYAENFSLPDLARAFYLTPQYLSAFFREHFSANFKSYLTEKRLFYALRDLRNTELGIAEVAMRNGFASVSAFQKNFRRYYGVSPSDYRAGYRSEKAGSAPAFTDEAALPLPSPSSELLLRADTPVTRLPRANRMINAGSISNLLSDRFRSSLLAFCREMNLSYVRVEELLSNSFMPMILPHCEYFYQNADIVLTFFYENGLIPFIELSKISFPAASQFKGREDFSCLPRNERFFRLLESFLKHVSRRWPVSWLSKWKFELHMLPRDTPEAYVEAFLRVRAIIAGLLPGAAVGGPGIDLMEETHMAKALLEAFARASAMPDFFSVFLYYSALRPGGKLSLCADPDAPFHALMRLRASLKPLSGGLPVYVTEWSSAPYMPAAVTASLYQASFIARTWTKLDSCSELAAYYLFSDAGPSPEALPVLSGFGRGLCGSSFIPYAAYFAYALSARLGERLVADRGGCRLVLAEDNHYQLLAHHYLHISAASDPAVEDITDFDKTYGLFESEEPRDFRIRLTGLTPGLYHTTLTVIDKAHGSLLDVLIEEYTRSNIDPLDFLQYARTPSGRNLPYRIGACLPLERSAYRSVETDMLLAFTLAPHAVCLFDIRRLI